MIKGTIFIVSAPSGAGKTSIINKSISILSNIKLSVSYTSRSIRGSEIDSVDYHFVTKKRFQDLIKKNFFLEWADVFGNYYGTSLQSLNQELSLGKDLFLDIDWQGAMNIKKSKDIDVRTIYILPPSREELQSRLVSRNTDSSDTVSLRMKQAVSEIEHYESYDYLIVNDNFDKAVQDMCSVITSHSLLTYKQTFKHKFDIIPF